MGLREDLDYPLVTGTLDADHRPPGRRPGHGVLALLDLDCWQLRAADEGAERGGNGLLKH